MFNRADSEGRQTHTALLLCKLIQIIYRTKVLWLIAIFVSVLVRNFLAISTANHDNCVTQRIHDYCWFYPCTVASGIKSCADSPLLSDLHRQGIFCKLSSRHSHEQKSKKAQSIELAYGFKSHVWTHNDANSSFSLFHFNVVEIRRTEETRQCGTSNVAIYWGAGFGLRYLGSISGNVEFHLSFTCCGHGCSVMRFEDLMERYFLCIIYCDFLQINAI